MIELFKLLSKKSKFFYVALVMLGLMTAVLNLGLLIFINSTVNESKLPGFIGEWPGYSFLGLLIISFVLSNVFERYIIRLTNDIRFEMILVILDKLKDSTYQRFEKLGKEKVFTAMADSRELGDLPEVFMNTFNSLIMVLCCVGYMFYISWVGGLVVFALMIILITIYIYRNTLAEKNLNELRDLQDDFFVYLNDLLHGYKELKLSSKMTGSIFHKNFYPNRRIGKSLATDVAIRYMNNDLTGRYSWFIALGGIMFGLPLLIDFDSSQALGFITTILYMIGPIAVLITLVPVMTKVKIALARLKNYDELIKIDHIDDRSQAKELNANDKKAVNSICFNDVVFEYDNEDKERNFKVGPLNLEIKRGELIFITGGNGSGKSTFVNLLTGLYQPQSGEILLKGSEEVSNKSLEYSNYFSAVFTNPYLFQKAYHGQNLDSENTMFKDLVSTMKLDSIIEVNEKESMVNTRLSKGQQKRLALIYALMEDNPILVLDEWAAEQDPEFRAYFYKNLLPRLQKEGKTIIAITHDDAYFDRADRVMKFDYGSIRETSNQMVNEVS